MEQTVLSQRDIAHLVVDTLVDHLAEDTVLLDISKQSILADYFVITNGANERQVRALAEHVIEELDKVGVKPVRAEGMRDGRWVAIDFNGVLVHIFTPNERRFYNLDELWSSGTTVARLQ